MEYLEVYRSTCICSKWLYPVSSHKDLRRFLAKGMDQPIEEDLMEFLQLSPQFWRISYWEVSQVEAIAWQLMHTVYRFYFLIVQDLPVSEIMHWDVLGYGFAHRLSMGLLLYGEK